MANKLPNNLPQLQNLIKRDPGSYKDEFLQQYRHYQSNLQIFQLKPSQYSKTLDELLIFLAQVAQCYPDEMATYPQDLRDLLQRHASTLDRTMRMTLCKSLILLRNKNLIPATTVLELFFELFRCQDKLLRKTLYTYIVNDIKQVNHVHKNMKLNSSLQNFMFTMLKDNNPTAAKMSLDVMIELYRRNIWKDAKTVNVITTCCFSKVTKILVAAIKFFLGTNDMSEDDSDDDDDKVDKFRKTQKEVIMKNRVAKKTRKRQRKLEKALANLKNNNKKKSQAESFNFSALHLIHDPQGLCEKMFKQLETTTERFEVKLMMIDFISRLVGVHQLFLFNFYPYIQRFLQPHQREVTHLLLFAAQASHDLVPPEIIDQVIRTIANNFISDRNSGEVMAVGMNAVKEICCRCPLAISEDLLQDLALYKTHKDKSVMMAARSLIAFYRKVNPELLHRKDKGRPTAATADLKVLKYGERDAKSFLPGTEALEDTSTVEAQEAQQEDWESCSEEEEEDDSDGEWVDVHHSSDEEVDESLAPTSMEDRLKKAQEVSTSRILSQEEFRKLQAVEAARQTESAKKGGSSKKRKREDPENESTERGELLSLGMIENVYKRRAHDKESRLATVLAGREGREKFAHGHQKMNPHASTTNRDKQKKKAFVMVKHKVMNRKSKRSFRDKQIALRNQLLKRQKRS